MKHIEARKAGQAPDAGEMNRVHYEGPGFLGMHTLCGYVDVMDWDWVVVNKRVNCKGCIAVRNHVLGKRRRAALPSAQRNGD